LSSGGNRRILSVQALLQILLPMGGFTLAVLSAKWLTKHRKGLR
jgi:ABC-type uncharacterized transport system YnjBCD permease subunit